VVDPGVGTARKAILAEVDGHRFIAPDNGVLSLILNGNRQGSFFELSNTALFQSYVSSTFHGRDIFASVAGHLAISRVPGTEVGSPLDSVHVLPDLATRQTGQNEFAGIVLNIDHFGNVISNFRAEDFQFVRLSSFRFQVGGAEITRFQKTFGDRKQDEPFVYFGSSGYVEFGLNQERAADKLGARIGDSITLHRS
jgi:S-adenosyl-L-methionine hydrolase (adenosine-forming)